MECKLCGGEMVLGIPGDVYCPNKECSKWNTTESIRVIKEMHLCRDIDKAKKLLEENGYVVTKDGYIVTKMG